VRERNYKEYQPGATWRTMELVPRYLKVLGNVAIDERMLLAELELDGGKVWLQRATGQVYKQGQLIAVAECVVLGDAKEIQHDRL
jgi:hypothetical protein